MASVAIIGAGIIGQGWAVAFAVGGWEVCLYDQDPLRLPAARQNIEQSLSQLQHFGLLDDALATVNRIESLSSLAGRKRWTHIQECVFEDLDLKREVLAWVEDASDHATTVASSSTTFRPSDLSWRMRHPERFLVAHPLNPPYLLPAVELIPSSSTSDEAVSTVTRHLRDIGLSPILLRADADPVLTRLHGAMLRECFQLVSEGAISPEDVDHAIRDGLGLRWCFLGPFETIDLNAPAGIVDFAQRYGPAYARLFSKHGVVTVPWDGQLLKTVDDSLRKKTPESALAARRSWRDERLMALRAHLHRQTTQLPSGPATKT